MASYTKDDSQLAQSRANKRANAQARLEARRAAMAQKHTKQLEANGAPAAVVEEIVKEEVLPASSFWFCSMVVPNSRVCRIRPFVLRACDCWDFP